MTEVGTYAVIAGGGTAGHVLPALAVGQALVRRGHPAETIHFVGSRRGAAGELVPEAGFAITRLAGRGVVRRVSVDSATAVARLGLAFLQALRLLARMRPAVVLSNGGYVGLPVSAAAAALRIPLVLANPDAVANTANRMVGRLATASAVAFDGTALPRSTVTGTPLRAELSRLDRSPRGRRAARRALGLPEDRFTIAVASGSLGSRRINQVVVALSDQWRARSDISIYHVIGRRDWSELARPAPAPAPAGQSALGRAGPEAAGGLCYRQVEYQDDMARLLAAADVLVGRAGAGTVAEIALVGLPAVLVPLPGAPGDHQSANARAMASIGGAVVVADAECTAGRLATEIDRLRCDPARLARMEQALCSHGRPHAADDVAALVEASARRRRDRRQSRG